MNVFVFSSSSLVHIIQRWIRTVSQQHPDLNYIYLVESIHARSIADKLASEMTDILDNEGEAPDNVFGVSLESIDVSEGEKNNF